MLNGERGIPNILVVLDRSGSMGDDNKWRDAVAAIKNVTSNLENGVAFGLLTYPSGGGTQSDSQCGAGNMDVSPATGSAGQIANELDTSGGPGGRTPTAGALDLARATLGGIQGASYVLLVTDGAPNCTPDLNPDTCTSSTSGTRGGATSCLDDARSVASVAALAEVNIPTYVIGFDTGDWGPVLDAMASAGGTGLDAYFPVNDGASLEGTLSQLAGNAISCSYTLDSTPADYRYVEITLDGAPLPHTSQTNDGSGWELNGNRIDLKGATCEGLKSRDDAELGISVQCELVLL
ncbi:MAG: vWA domain-containing protein [Polyangiales bacterium]